MEEVYVIRLRGVQSASGSSASSSGLDNRDLVRASVLGLGVLHVTFGSLVLVFGALRTGSDRPEPAEAVFGTLFGPLFVATGVCAFLSWRRPFRKLKMKVFFVMAGLSLLDSCAFLGLCLAGLAYFHSVPRLFGDAAHVTANAVLAAVGEAAVAVVSLLTAGSAVWKRFQCGAFKPSPPHQRKVIVKTDILGGGQPSEGVLDEEMIRHVSPHCVISLRQGDEQREVIKRVQEYLHAQDELSFTFSDPCSLQDDVNDAECLGCVDRGAVVEELLETGPLEKSSELAPERQYDRVQEYDVESTGDRQHDSEQEHHVIRTDERWPLRSISPGRQFEKLRGYEVKSTAEIQYGSEQEHHVVEKRRQEDDIDSPYDKRSHSQKDYGMNNYNRVPEYEVETVERQNGSEQEHHVMPTVERRQHEDGIKQAYDKQFYSQQNYGMNKYHTEPQSGRKFHSQQDFATHEYANAPTSKGQYCSQQERKTKPYLENRFSNELGNELKPTSERPLHCQHKDNNMSTDERSCGQYEYNMESTSPEHFHSQDYIRKPVTKNQFSCQQEEDNMMVEAKNWNHDRNLVSKNWNPQESASKTVENENYNNGKLNIDCNDNFPRDGHVKYPKLCKNDSRVDSKRWKDEEKDLGLDSQNWRNEVIPVDSASIEENSDAFVDVKCLPNVQVIVQ